MLSFIHLTTLPQEKGRKSFRYIEKNGNDLKHKLFFKIMFVMAYLAV